MPGKRKVEVINGYNSTYRTEKRRKSNYCLSPWRKSFRKQNEFSWFTSKCSEWHFQQIEDWNIPLICFYDNDLEGNKGWMKIHKRLGDSLPSINRVVPPTGRDAGNFNEEELKTELSRHWKP